VEHRVHVQLAFVLPDVREGDVLGMADEPGGLMVERGVPLIE
jgi:hypothetical protein